MRGVELEQKTQGAVFVAGKKVLSCVFCAYYESIIHEFGGLCSYFAEFNLCSMANRPQIRTAASALIAMIADEVQFIS